VYLKFDYRVPAITNLLGSTAGAAFLVVWTFTADQRAARDDTPSP